MTKKLLKEIDEAVARLQSVRALVLAGMAAHRGAKGKATRVKTAKTSAKKQRTVSEEGRERIRQAQLRRWAAVRRKAKKATA